MLNKLSSAEQNFYLNIKKLVEANRDRSCDFWGETEANMTSEVLEELNQRIEYIENVWKD